MKREYEIEEPSAAQRGMEDYTVSVLPLDGLCGDKKRLAYFRRKEDAVLFVKARQDADASTSETNLSTGA